MSNKDKLAGIEYAGIHGLTRECRLAIMRFLQFGDNITLARILTCQDGMDCFHAFLFTLNEADLVAIKAGFASGYSGEGPAGFAHVLHLLEAHNIDVEEYLVDREFMNKLEQSALTVEDIKNLHKTEPVRPVRWYQYIPKNYSDPFADSVWWDWFPPIIPYRVVDSRIIDIAVNFWRNPDNNLLTAYRRLEDLVRKRTGLEEEGVKLFSRAFTGDKSLLRWKNLSASETVGRAQLFTGVYMSHRNPRGHNEPKKQYYDRLLAEFLLINQLFRLEKEAYRTRIRKN